MEIGVSVRQDEYEPVSDLIRPLFKSIFCYDQGEILISGGRNSWFLLTFRCTNPKALLGLETILHLYQRH